MRRAALLALLPSAALAQNPVALDCATEEGEAFRVLLWQESTLGAPLHCVEWVDLSGVGSCAPQGGWGLTDPARPGEVARIATKPDEALGEGGKFFAHVGLSEFVASASQGAGLPLALEVAGETFWRLRMTLATGEGVVATRAGESRFNCAAP